MVRVGKSGEPLSPELFNAAWALYPKRPGNNKKAAVEAWNARINEGVDPSEMLAGVQAYAMYLKTCPPSSPNYIKQASTFFGPKHHFSDDYTVDEVEQHGAKSPAAGLMKFYAEERLV